MCGSWIYEEEKVHVLSPGIIILKPLEPAMILALKRGCQIIANV
jgi:hypothetical protein